MGPFTVTGVIMDESASGCWTNHQSITEFNHQWYLFYHNSDLSPRFDKNRSIRIDSLFFEKDGTIRKVIPTLRGVGLTKATSAIQIDRYSHISPGGVSIAFLDTTNTFAGWKTVFHNSEGWIQYNSVDFGSQPLKTLQARVVSATGATLQVWLDHAKGPLLAEVKVTGGNQWQVVTAPVKGKPSGVHHLVVSLKGQGSCEVDWVKFE